MSAKKLLLLDAYALIYRAYYAFIKNPRINSKGLNTSAVLGFTNTLDELLRKERPTHVVVAFDRPEDTFRHQLFEQYKAHRPPMPDDLRNAVPYIRSLIEGFGIPTVELPGYEADDLIGTLAKRAESEGFQVFMVTPDKDYCQLVSDSIFILKPKTGQRDQEVWGPKEVQENFNVQHPQQVIDVLALMGDTADNIPGAEGVGEKGARELIGQYGSVEGLYANIDQLKGKKKEKILASRQKVDLALQLIRIDTQVPIDFDLDSCLYSGPDAQKLMPLFDELEFRTIAQRILGHTAPVASTAPARQISLFDTPEMQDTTPLPSYLTAHQVPHSYWVAQSTDEVAELVGLLNQQTEFCFDTETTDLHPQRAQLVGMSFAWQAHQAYYVPVPAQPEEAQKLIEAFRPVFENPRLGKVGQNIKFDLLVLANYQVRLAGPLFDTMVAHYLIDPDQRHNMNHLAELYLGYSPIKIEELLGEKGPRQKNMRQVALEQIKEYAAEDADITWQLKEKLAPELDRLGLRRLFDQVEMPLVYVLADMERAGVRIDVPALNEYAVQLRHDIQRVETDITQLAGYSFNIGSAKQLGELLFDRLKLDANAKKTGKSGQYATDERTLQKLAAKHPIVELVLEHRQLKKLLSTYVEALPLLVQPSTGKLHTTYAQAVAATGRLSSSDPNLQNIPIRTQKGRELRKAFVATDAEHLLLAADYSQIELRIIAHLSADPNMIEAFAHDADIHAATAAKIHHVPIEDVTREMRANAKGANFGIVYGISSFGLAENLGIARSEAKALIDGYFASYPGVKVFMDQNIAFARQHEYVQTILGRRRPLPDINSRDAQARGAAERNAINAPIQGSAADIIKLAMIRIHQRLQSEGLRSRMILQVHDELVFDALASELEKLKTLVAEEMQQAVQLSVPLKVDMGWGQTWLVAH